MLSKSHYDCTRSNLCNRPSNNFCYDFEISSRGASHDSELIRNFLEILLELWNFRKLREQKWQKLHFSIV